MDFTRAAVILLSFLLFIGLILYGGLENLLKAGENANLGVLVLALLTICLAMAVRIYRWKVLIGDISFLELAPIQMFGIAVSSLTPGKLAEPAKAVILKRTHGIPLTRGVSSVVLERVSDIIAVVVFSLLAFLYFEPIVVFIPVAIFGGAVVAILAATQSKFVRDLIVRIASVFSKRIAQIGAGFMDQLKLDGKFLKAVALAFVIWSLDSLTAVIVFTSFGLQFAPGINPYIVAASLVSLTVLIGLLSMLPGGIGSTEISFSLLLESVGVQKDLAIAAVLMFRLITFWISIGAGLAMSVFIKEKMKKMNAT
ncbi:MAG: lysylphosphatidylglycerol synthase transmembrane domain-containing protein [Candidatus Micrarchaeota archaeon]|nr:lysylphosphatidylglycerol synthase transmembrane domain-containing protein [Candidatus Micrarchaeota archaeon]